MLIHIHFSSNNNQDVSIGVRNVSNYSDCLEAIKTSATVIITVHKDTSEMRTLWIISGSCFASADAFTSFKIFMGGGFPSLDVGFPNIIINVFFFPKIIRWFVLVEPCFLRRKGLHGNTTRIPSIGCWRDYSAGHSACNMGWWPEFDLLNPCQGGRKEETPHLPSLLHLSSNTFCPTPSWLVFCQLDTS